MFVSLVDIDRLPAFQRNEAHEKTSFTNGLEVEVFRVVQKAPSPLIVDDHLGQLQEIRSGQLQGYGFFLIIVLPQKNLGKGRANAR